MSVCSFLHSANVCVCMVPRVGDVAAFFGAASLFGGETDENQIDVMSG